MLRNTSKEIVSKNINVSEKPTNSQLKRRPIQKAVTESLRIKTKAKPQKDLLTEKLSLKQRKIKHDIDDTNDQDKVRKIQRERNSILADMNHQVKELKEKDNHLHEIERTKNVFIRMFQAIRHTLTSTQKRKPK